MEQRLRPVLFIAKIIFLAALSYFAIRLVLYHYYLVIFPYASSLREGSMMTSTAALVHGINPFDMSLQPQLMNQYGIIYPLLVWPWAKLFGTTILVHRIVIAIGLLISCLTVFLVLKRMKVPVLLNLWAVLMLYASLLYPGTSTPAIDPGAVGMMFFLLTIFIPWFYKYSYPSMTISIICGILGFYTKSYAFLGVPFLLSYIFLFVSRLKSLYYGLILLLLSVISIVLVDRIFPAYFDNCFFSHVNMEHAWASAERLQVQIVMYRALHMPIFILWGIMIIWFGYQLIKEAPWAILRNKITEIIMSFISMDIRQPMIKWDFSLVLYMAMCSSFVLYVSLGRHSGAMLWYFFQLLSPFLLIGSAWVFGRFNYWPIVCVPLLIYNLHILTVDHNYKIFNKNMPGWSQITMLLSQHQHILNSPLIAPILVEQHKEVIDNGQAEYFGLGGERQGWMKNVFKEDERVSLQLTLFFLNIRNRVENKEFDLIVLQPSLLPSGVADDIRKYYKDEGQLLLYAPQDHRSYAVTVWLPQ